MKVIVVDDDKTLRTIISRGLTNAGYEVTEAKNGLLAWERLRKEKIDIAVLDINMPKMNGFQLLKKIRTDKKFKNMPVIMLSVRNLAEDQVEGYDTGADDYLPKPFKMDMLCMRIKLLERRILKKEIGKNQLLPSQ